MAVSHVLEKCCEAVIHHEQLGPEDTLGACIEHLELFLGLSSIFLGILISIYFPPSLY